MVLPMLIVAAGCVLFGVYNQLPLKLLHSAAHFPRPGCRSRRRGNPAHHSWQVTPVTMLAMGFLVSRLFVAFFVGRDPYAPVLDRDGLLSTTRRCCGRCTDWSEKRYFDIYEQGSSVPALVGRPWSSATSSAPRTGWLKELRGSAWRSANACAGFTPGLLAVYLSWLVFGIVILLLLVGGSSISRELASLLRVPSNSGCCADTGR